MPEQDSALKDLFLLPDVAANFVNAYACGGQEKILPSFVKPLPTETELFVGDRFSKLIRDVCLKICGSALRFVWLGFEFQSRVDPNMAARVFAYDAALVQKRLREERNALIPPVVTFVLYFGQKPWNAPTSLRERTDFDVEFPRELEPFCADYKMNLVDFSALPKNVVRALNPDLYALAEICRCARDRDDYVGDGNALTHPRETLRAASAVTGLQSYSQFYHDASADQLRSFKMDYAWESAEKRGFDRGYDKGYDKGAAEIIRLFQKSGFSQEEIARVLATPSGEFLRFLNLSNQDDEEEDKE